MKNDHLLKVALAQISHVWFKKEATLQKIKNSFSEAAKNHAELLKNGWQD